MCPLHAVVRARLVASHLDESEPGSLMGLFSPRNRLLPNKAYEKKDMPDKIETMMPSQSSANSSTKMHPTPTMPERILSSSFMRAPTNRGR